MLQIAVFVDAGYLYAQGSALVSGGRQRPRAEVRLNVAALLVDLLQEAKAIEPNARLLRIYWYDGVARGGLLNVEQRAVAESENVKVRFGTINSRGEQKGVDSLIVTDLIELSRSHAISDALIVSGDEDIRVGVQVAQTFGIRVHLLGVQPARGSQSPDLVAEADTLREWERNKVADWLSVISLDSNRGGIEGSDGNLDWIGQVIAQRIEPLSHPDIAAIHAYAADNRNQLPADFDRPALASARNLLQRALSDEERKSLRIALLEAIRTRLNPDQSVQGS